MEAALIAALIGGAILLAEGPYKLLKKPRTNPEISAIRFSPVSQRIAPLTTADGAGVLYVSNKSGVRDIWVRNSGTEMEEALTQLSYVGIGARYRRMELAWPILLSLRMASASCS
jgi:hypothetical protein